MSRKKTRTYKAKDFESTGIPNDTSANIYGSMLESPAFKDLSKNQRLLYIYMKKQYYGTRKPKKDFPNMEQLQGDDLFYFNLSLAVKYELYTKSNKRQFYSDVSAIEQHGFIKTISNGKSTKSRSIYQFVGDWKEWSDSS